MQEYLLVHDDGTLQVIAAKDLTSELRQHVLDGLVQVVKKAEGRFYTLDPSAGSGLLPSEFWVEIQG